MSGDLRRLRRTAELRKLVREVHVDSGDLIYPIFVKEGLTSPEPIESMPGISRLPVGLVAEEAVKIQELGIGAMLVFGLPTRKDETGEVGCDPDGIVPQAVRAIKDATPSLPVITDVCVCAYTSHGHCGVLDANEIDNVATLPVLTRMALSHAKAGADFVAPSAMMDGQVAALRAGLAANGMGHKSILAYSSKFASAFYGPFREAADSTPSFGDRQSYQHDYANARHAKRELLQDVAEGADILMVKPGLAYLDIVRLARESTDLPIAAYSVSGEYSMIKAAAERGWLDEKRVVIESLTAFKRAGADLIITYYAKEASKWLKEF